MSKAKPFSICKRVVFDAYKRVKANQGAAGVDGESVSDFEQDLKNNLYKIWNRMSSGSYFPPAVRLVEVAKKSGGQRKLGVPTVSDRIAQMVAKMYFEPEVDQYFHPDSYGYRPGKSAIEAVGVARKRSWRYNWVVDLDIKGHFGSAPSFVVFDTEAKSIDTINNQDLGHAHGMCSPLKALDGKMVDVIVVGGIGAGAINKLNGMGIKVYKASKGTVRDNIGLFESNTMSEITVEHACGGHAGGCAH